jgi:hypothetical protein
MRMGKNEGKATMASVDEITFCAEADVKQKIKIQEEDSFFLLS